jgi:NAD-dependent SIR2 family protein deacetylase
MNDEINFYKVECSHCKKNITGKPWISVNYKKDVFHGCSYSCGIKLNRYVGNGYWKDVINKEDFNEPRPVSTYKERKDITFHDLSEIKRELAEEEERIQKMEEEYDLSSSDYSDEENLE